MKDERPEKVRVNVYLEKAQYEWLRKKAFKQKRSMSSILRDMLDNKMFEPERMDQYAN